MHRPSDHDISARLASSYPEGLEAWLQSRPDHDPTFGVSVRTLTQLEKPDTERRRIAVSGNPDSTIATLRQLGAIVVAVAASHVDYIWA